MGLSGWKRLGVVVLCIWWLFWIAVFFIARADRNRAISVDEAVTGERWTAATWNPLVADAQIQMNYAVLAIVTPLVIGVIIYAIRWVTAGFRRQV